MADKAAELLAKLEAHQTKGAELLAELRAVLDAEPTAGQNAKRILDYFAKNWEKKYRGQKFVLTNAPKYMGELKRICEQVVVDEVAARVKAYFSGEDKFVVDARHSLPVFISRFNELTSTPLVGAQAVIGCTHEPRCYDDAEHTRKQLADRRTRQ